ncbi:MAG: Pvc16 family protein [Anaerolineae bacterium]|nr:Pvc16 family protein [Anaerolineae bacterium]
MLADLDETIRKLLIAEIPIRNSDVDVSFEQPKREWSARLAKPAINLFLYDVRENNILRQHQWERLDNNGRPKSEGIALKRTPMRVDCSYIMTTWAADPEDEHRLLTRAMLVLFRFPTLPNKYLTGAVQNPPFDIQARLASHDKLTEPTDLWNVLDNEMHPSVSYMITLALDPWTEITGPLVRTRILRFGPSTSLPDYQELSTDAGWVDMITIGGTVRTKSGDEPAAGFEVAIKGTGLFTTTDSQGRFRLGSVPPGSYTLVVWLPDGKMKQKKVTIPTEDGNYDMEV